MRMKSLTLRTTSAGLVNSDRLHSYSDEVKCVVLVFACASRMRHKSLTHESFQLVLFPTMFLRASPLFAPSNPLSLSR